MKKILIIFLTGFLLILSGCEKDIDFVSNESHFINKQENAISIRFEPEVEDAINTGIDWLKLQQNPDGSFGGVMNDDAVGRTGFAITKLCDRSIELGYMPLEEGNPLKSQIELGLTYLFKLVGDLDGNGFYITDAGTLHHSVYNTGIAMMAIASANSLDKVISLPGYIADGYSYLEILEQGVEFYNTSQYLNGGWYYYDATYGDADNSNTGFAVLGLLAAESVGCVIPPEIKVGLSGFVDYLQDASGGSGYRYPGEWVNLLKTGNFLFEMGFIGDLPEDMRVQNALGYIQNNWDATSGSGSGSPGWKPNNYLAMYTMMKGFVVMGVDEIEVGGATINWYDEFVSYILADLETGAWPLSAGPWTDPYLSSVLGLLVLEKVTPGIPDSDDDGCFDEEDPHPNSIIGGTIFINDCITEITNEFVTDCSTMMDFLNDCALNANNHGEYVSCVAHLTNNWKSAGLITGKQKGIIQTCAAHADIP